jgi:hypothetical protein
MRRRELIRTLGGAALAWSLAVHAQQPERLRRVGVVIPFPENDPSSQARATAFAQELERLGWVEAKNIHIDYRFAAGDRALYRAYAHRDVIIAAAARHRLPDIGIDIFPRAGGLMSYWFDGVDLYAQAASYIDRILRGASPADLPVQQPTKYLLIINLKTAKVLGLTVPPNVLDIADEVIE